MKNCDTDWKRDAALNATAFAENVCAMNLPRFDVLVAAKLLAIPCEIVFTVPSSVWNAELDENVWLISLSGIKVLIGLIVAENAWLVVRESPRIGDAKSLSVNDAKLVLAPMKALSALVDIENDDEASLKAPFLIVSAKVKTRFWVANFPSVAALAATEFSEIA